MWSVAQVPSPYADSVDFLLQHGNLGTTLTAARYAVAILAGEVALDTTAIAQQLLPWVQTTGGTDVVFASQLTTPTASASFTGAVLSAPSKSTAAQLVAVADEDSGWRHNRSAPTPSPFAPPPPPPPASRGAAPFCVAHDSARSSFYIKVGGNATVTEGWDGGKADKCCRAKPSRCAYILVKRRKRHTLEHTCERNEIQHT